MIGSLGTKIWSILRKWWLLKISRSELQNMSLNLFLLHELNSLFNFSLRHYGSWSRWRHQDLIWITTFLAAASPKELSDLSITDTASVLEKLIFRGPHLSLILLVAIDLLVLDHLPRLYLLWRGFPRCQALIQCHYTVDLLLLVLIEYLLLLLWEHQSNLRGLSLFD